MNKEKMTAFLQLCSFIFPQGSGINKNYPKESLKKKQDLSCQLLFPNQIFEFWPNLFETTSRTPMENWPFIPFRGLAVSFREGNGVTYLIPPKKNDGSKLFNRSENIWVSLSFGQPRWAIRKEYSVIKSMKKTYSRFLRWIGLNGFKKY